MDAADGVDRRQVEDVEAHARDVGEPLLEVAEGAVAAGPTGRARKHLVPGPAAGALGLDDDLELAAQRGPFAAVGVALHQGLEPLFGSHRHRSAVLAQRLRERAQPRAARTTNPTGRRLHHLGSDLDLELHVLVRLDPLCQLTAPGLEGVDPALEGELVPAELRDRELGPPAVVDQRCHRGFRPFAARVVAVA